MLYIIDTANLEAIEKAYNFYPMAGVTTNPTIISKENKNFLVILKGIRKIIGAESMLHVQAVSLTAEKMVQEAEYLNSVIGGNLYVKIPVIPEGIKAIKILKQKGIKTTATAIFTAQQALIAAVAGASFVAPYVNRIDNISGDGVSVVAQIVQLFDQYDIDAKVLAASFKNVQQVHNVALVGGHSVTVNPEILDAMLAHPLTDWSVNQFVNDWESVYGIGKTTIDVK
ncbi:fructose-6-phosphate aldolase [Clostridium estertheticum]|uniref:Fructose-6-phosphate aldolase n=1 Tax=Clostridium estertheticum subsp. estertheticum TaxID=1552 RepID=A0A1J0GF51_9CLOT|nr:fructose-6-phosphate aldolase [Clostridium estertheticum]APC39957.1 fructose-6-phosphate aldolase [Clostridium estertheticum subsp. estertheticum]MBZ9613969.1 fructose-6-phosphate aldolase [Clostridium estertheticum subsp. laramiense]WAG73927.1 fructose-6-phosphate aldolase [Clostridium estertheticum]